MFLIYFKSLVDNWKNIEKMKQLDFVKLLVHCDRIDLNKIKTDEWVWK